MSVANRRSWRAVARSIGSARPSVMAALHRRFGSTAPQGSFNGLASGSTGISTFSGYFWHAGQ